MANPLDSKDVIAGAVIERPLPGSHLTSEQKATKRLQEALQAQGAKKAIEAMGLTPVPEDRIKNAIENNVNYTHDNKGERKRSTAEKDTVRDMSQKAEVANKYLQEGFDKLNPADQVNLRTVVEEEIKKSFPEAHSILGTLGAGKDAVLDNMLKDPAFARFLRQRLESATDPSNKLPEISALLRTRLNEAKAKSDAAERERKRAQDDLDLTDATRNKWLEIDPDTGVKGVKLDELDTLKAARPAKETDLANKTVELDQAKDDLAITNARLERMIRVNPTDPDIPTVQGEKTNKQTRVRSLSTDIARIQTDIHQITELENQKNALEETRRTQQKALDEATLAKAAAEREKIEAQIEIDDINIDRQRTQTAFEDKMGHLFEGATQDYLTQRMEKVEAERQKLIDEDKGKETDDRVKAFKTQLQKRWNEDSSMKYKLKKDVVNADFDSLMNEGPSGPIKSLLRDAGVTNPDQFLKDNPSFLENNQSDVVNAIVSKKLQTGKLSEADAQHIVDSPWGATAIQDALSKNSELKPVIDHLKGEKVIKNNKDLLKWILIILAGIITAGAVPVGLAAAGVLPIIAANPIAAAQVAGATGAAVGGGGALVSQLKK